jgi:hypothetical protein
MQHLVDANTVLFARCVMYTLQLLPTTLSQSLAPAL